jgi:hypothetical protein
MFIADSVAVISISAKPFTVTILSLSLKVFKPLKIKKPKTVRPRNKAMLVA